MAIRALNRDELEKLDSIWKSPGYLAAIIAVACAFGAWLLLLPVIPTAVLDAGGSNTLAGATTGIFMATTVVTQIFTPRLLRQFGYNPVMVVSAMLLGVPALGYLLGMTAGPALLFSAIRGVGFGALTVAQSALIAELVPHRLLGKATGTMGLLVGLSQMVGLPLGLFIVDSTLGFPAACVLAAIIGLTAGAMCMRIPKIRPTTQVEVDSNAALPEGPQDDNQGQARPAQARGPQPTMAAPTPAWKLVTVPAIAICSLSMSFGAVSSFLPAAVRELDPVTGAVLAGLMLSVVGGAGMIFRYSSGIIADKRGVAGGTMIPGQILGLVGIGLMALVLAQGWSVWWLVLAAILFGGGFGFVQNESLLTMFARLPRSQISSASAYWNSSYDAGTGIGSFILGAVAAQAAYAGAFGVGSAIIAAGLVVTCLDKIGGKYRIAETNNTRARLRRIPVAYKAVQGARRLRGKARRPQRPGPRQ
ncbi:major facilitator superfamily permease [Corynebacterium renale]|uniref:MFS transporter n=1 Tax=Corynebacterium renale TaxID=1724 RepID=UPI000DA37919|nr:MFS transporter [Corynebacterium renale]SQG64950.1 major facilitator superfamily permease [Corynebacterium renale]